MSNMDDEVDSELLDTIRQYQNSIIKHSELGNDAKILNYISKLYEMPITVAHLQDTGIGRTVNSLRKYNGDVGSASRAIVNKWKTMVAKEEEENTGDQPTEEDSSPSSTSSSLDKHETRSDSRSEERHRSKDKHERRSDSSDKHSRKHESSDKSSKSKHEDSSNKHKSHSRHDEKKDSHKSSHSRDKEHKSSSGETERKHRKEEKSRHDKKRKYAAEEEPSSVKKKRYESDEYEDDDDDHNNDVSPTRCNGSGLQIDDYPDSTVSDEQEKEFANPSEDYREHTQSPVPVEESKSSTKHKKHHKSDKQHRSHEKDSEKKFNGHSSSSSSSKKSSHRDKETKRVEEKSSRSEKASPSKKPDSKDSKSKHSSSTAATKSSEKMLSPSKVKKEIMMQDDNGIDSGSGASFAEALGMIVPTKGTSTKTTYKKKTVYSAPASPTPSTSSMKPSRTAKSTTLSPLVQSPNLLSPNLKLEPLVLNPSQLPEITTNYKPLANTCTYEVPSPSSIHNLKNLTEEEALSVVISSKTQRTKVYSGNKTNWGYVPTLFNLCVRVLQDNIDSLEFTGGVPYEILKPVLERATANQLLNAEYYNPYLIEETDELWELHCKKECKGQKRQEMETWREMYLRCRDERDAKLKALTVNIKQSIDKCLPVRQTKLAYVDSVVKPPRGVARKQAKYGTDGKPTITPSSRLSAIAAGGPDKISVPNPGARAASSSSSGAMMKPKKAPLMQKTLALMKGRFGRR